MSNSLLGAQPDDPESRALRVALGHEAVEAQSLSLEQRVELLEAQGLELKAHVERVLTLFESRNKSAATKRNMTDEDALEVMTGKYKGLKHQDAADAVGLTYAQVYSCRMQFTFKHVHKDLKVQQWTNPWLKHSGRA